MFKNLDKGDIHRAFPQFFSEYPLILYFLKRHCINIVFILQKNHINPSPFMLWIK